jgi:hypothetical protein
MRYAFGPGFSYTYDQHFSYHGLVKYFVLHQKPNVLLENEVTFHGISVGIGMTYTFKEKLKPWNNTLILISL